MGLFNKGVVKCYYCRAVLESGEGIRHGRQVFCDDECVRLDFQSHH